MQPIYLFNTLVRKKELFTPLHPPLVGIYVCGPTVYGDPHLGHARPAITFDVLVRLFRFLGYKVRYVRNITDVGHLESDADTGEDKIEKRARLEQLEPMEVVQHYTLRFHDAMRLLNTLPPNIEPRASGHIMEQIGLVKEILDSGFAYESGGSVYFDVEAYSKQFRYGELSGRVIEELQNNTRVLEGQSEKRAPWDFALWKQASPEHIMRWPSPWGDGFPGWHLECSVMSSKYLGNEFDIHGGGLDLLFPHHECELAQNKAVRGSGGVRYWMHNNLITINGQKMGKSLGNFITLEELFTGNHKLLSQPFSPMAIRFFILQAHYRSTLDFSNDALLASEKGLKRLQSAAKSVATLSVNPAAAPFEALQKIYSDTIAALCDDLNTPVALAHIFDAVRWVNGMADKKEAIHPNDANLLHLLFDTVLIDVLGLRDNEDSGADHTLLNGLMEMILEARTQAKERKDYASSDAIRDQLTALGVTIKDTKEGVSWEIRKK